MKKTIILILLSIFTISAYAQKEDKEKRSADMSKERLRTLLADRKERFEKYQLAIEAKSGIFNTQSKKDLRNANEILSEIVQTDNTIMNELNRLLDYRSYEKVNMSYNLNETVAQTEKYTKSISILSNKVKELKDSNQQLSKSLKVYTFLTYLFLLLFVLTLIYLFATRRKRGNMARTGEASL